MWIEVMAPESDYWPLPWYLRRFKRVGWWDHVPEDASAPVKIVGTKLCAALDAKSNNDSLAKGIYGLRPGTELYLYVKPSLWQRYLQTKVER